MPKDQGTDQALIERRHANRGTDKGMRVLKLRNCTRIAVLSGIFAAAGGGIWVFAQDAPANSARTPVFKSRVDLVVLSFTVTDNKGKYVNGLKPSDFRIMEDGIKEKLSTFSEGNRPAMQILDDGTLKPSSGPAEGERVATVPVPGPTGDFTGTNVFVLFDTSNFMY